MARRRSSRQRTRPERAPGNNRLVYFAAVLFVVSAVGWLAANGLGGRASHTAEAQVPVLGVTAPGAGVAVPATGPSGPDASVPAVGSATGMQWGVPVGYPQSKPGARAAAVGWVSALGALMQMGPVAAGDTLRALLSDRSVADTIDEFARERKRFTKQFGADPVLALWIESPLQVTVDSLEAGRATVRVWSQLLMGVDSESSVTVQWHTQTVSLVWEHDDWRVDDVSRVEGPSPLPSAGVVPSPGREFAGPAGWTPAVSAGSPAKGDG